MKNTHAHEKEMDKVGDSGSVVVGGIFFFFFLVEGNTNLLHDFQSPHMMGFSLNQF